MGVHGAVVCGGGLRVRLHADVGVHEGDGGDDGRHDDGAAVRRLLPVGHHLQHQSGIEVAKLSFLCHR